MIFASKVSRRRMLQRSVGAAAAGLALPMFASCGKEVELEVGSRQGGVSRRRRGELVHGLSKARRL